MPDLRVTIGVDVGTTGCRACAVCAAGTPVAQASVAYEPDRPHPGWVEQDPEVWWDAFGSAVAQVRRRADVRHVSALGLSSQSTALLAVDDDCKALRKAVIWQDTRNSHECDEITRRFGPDLLRSVTGWRACTFLAWPKVLWLMQHEPALFERTRWLLQVSGFITQRLCGKIVLDRANAVGYPMDLCTSQWHEEMCRWRDFPVRKVPTIVPSTSVVGEVSPEASRACGVPAGTPIVAGGMDTACAALAIGAATPGKAFEVSGTSGGIGIISDAPCAHAALGVAPHVIEGLYINHAPMSAAGASLAWCKEVLCATDYETIEREVTTLGDGPTGLLFLPYMAGERAPVWDSRARGAMLGLTLGTTRAEVAKMVMEGVAYALRQNIDIAEAHGMRVEELLSCGGGSRSRAWCRIKADVTGKPLVVHRPERDAAFGAALLAGIGTALWTDAEVAGALAREGPQVYRPRPEVTALYAAHQCAYEQIYPHLREILRARRPG